MVTWRRILSETTACGREAGNDGRLGKRPSDAVTLAEAKVRNRETREKRLMNLANLRAEARNVGRGRRPLDPGIELRRAQTAWGVRPNRWYVMTDLTHQELSPLFGVEAADAGQNIVHDAWLRTSRRSPFYAFDARTAVDTHLVEVIELGNMPPERKSHLYEGRVAMRLRFLRRLVSLCLLWHPLPAALAAAHTTLGPGTCQPTSRHADTEAFPIG